MKAFPIANIEATTVANVFLYDFVSRFGTPGILHTDQGRNFESALMKAVCKLLGINKTRTTAYHPRLDGLIERFNRTLLNLLSMVTKEDQNSWDLQLPLMMMAYRTSLQESTECTPFHLVFEREARLPIDVMFGLPPYSLSTDTNQYAIDLRRHLELVYRQVRDNMEVQQRHQEELYDKSACDKPFEVGSMVWLHCPAVPRGTSPNCIVIGRVFIE